MIKLVKLWSDSTSTIVLRRIARQPNEFKIFVSKIRVTKIQDLIGHLSWHHVPSEKNPADMLSRDVNLDTLKFSQL